MEEGRPSCIVNRFGQDPRRQTFDVEVFDGHHAEVLHQLIGLPVLNISALIGHMLVGFLEQQDGLTPTF